MNGIVDREVWERLARKAREGIEIPSDPGPRFSPSAIAAVAGTALLFLAGAVGLILTQGSDTPQTFVSGVSLAVGFIGLAVAGQHLLNEAAIPRLPASDPGLLVEVFLSSLARERWDTARACLSKVARTRVERDAISAWGLKAASFNLALDPYFKACWAPFCASEGLSEVQLSHEVKRTQAIDSGLSVIWVTISVHRQTELLVATESSSLKLFGRFVAYRRGDAWYLLHGGLPLGPDVRIGGPDQETPPDDPFFTAPRSARPPSARLAGQARAALGGSESKSGPAPVKPAGRPISGRIIGGARAASKPQESGVSQEPAPAQAGAAPPRQGPQALILEPSSERSQSQIRTLSEIMGVTVYEARTRGGVAFPRVLSVGTPDEIDAAASRLQDEGAEVVQVAVSDLVQGELIEVRGVRAGPGETLVVEGRRILPVRDPESRSFELDPREPHLLLDGRIPPQAGRRGSGRKETEPVGYLLPLFGSNRAFRIRQTQVSDFTILGNDASMSQRQNLEALFELLSKKYGAERDDTLAQHAMLLEVPLPLLAEHGLEDAKEATLDIYARLFRARQGLS
ncbi:MAG: hypothetical protein JKY65_11970 [Planctomycetes bacterium]|nr:hypothetical protein [Planctomycetota bacterium]